MIRLGTIFSGIGAFEHALKQLGIPHKILFACDNGERDIQYDIEEEMKNVKKLSNAKEKCDYVRQLTYRECYRLMGFNDSYDYSKVNNLWRYRQAGNSIIVNVLEALMKEIMKVEYFNE